MSVADDLGAGTILAGFRVESLLGHGGMSTVYLAQDLRLKRRVALKVLAASLAADEEFRDRFLRESELAASIDHPHIVPIFQAGECGGVLYIAMRHVAGRDLKARLRDRPMELAEATAVLAQVADALDAAHARGLVHRDVKPSNILLDPGTGPDGSDHAYLADFGLTTRLADGPHAGDGGPLAGPLVGTIDYVAPEQIAGGVVDGRADVYALGCVLFECLVGEPPFRRDTDLQVVFAHLDTDPPAASRRRTQLPVALDAVIARALAKEPNERFSSCRELTHAVLTVVADEAGRHLAALASRAAAGRTDLSDVESELAGTVIELQAARERADAQSGVPTPVGAAARGECPFKGLASYETADAGNFFGRDRLIAELVARLAGARFLGIVGPSGSGKSSVLRAGLIPALGGGLLPGSEGWRTVLVRPGDRPVEQLGREITPAADERVLLVVDQLEELFTAYDSPEERDAFADALVWGPAIVVVALRADFYGRVAAHPALADRLGANHVLVGPMRAPELRRAVEGPAARVGLRVQPELVDRLVEDVQGEPGALPLLSTALVELWRGRRDDTLSLASYREIGGVRGAIARLAESTYATVPDEHRPLVRAIMLRLVGDGDGDAAVRRRAPLTELDLRRRDVASVLTTLVDGRLVTVSQDTVEVAHEALLREWPRLRGWIDEDAEGRRLHRHLIDAAIEWDRSGRDPSELYRGARLAAALDWSTDHPVELNALEREFIASSRDAAQWETRRVRRTNTRLRVSLAAVAVFLVAALVGGTLAVIQRGDARIAADQARDAETAQFAQRLGAQALVEENLDTSLLLARQAVAISDTPQTRASLLTVLAKAPAAIGIMHVDDDAHVSDATLSPDGETLAVLDNDKIQLFDTRTYQRIGDPLTGATWPNSFAYSPDGSVLAFGGGDAYGRGGQLHLVDGHTRAELTTTAIEGPPTYIAFSSDGTRLVIIAMGEAHNIISIRDAHTLDNLVPPIELTGFGGCDGSLCAGHVALTPDGRSVVTSGRGGLAWWDIQTGQRTRILAIEPQAPAGATTPDQGALDISPDGHQAAVGIDHGIQLVDLDSGASRTSSGGLTRSPHRVRFSPDGATVVSANYEGTVMLWDATTAAVRKTLHGHGVLVLASAFSADGTTLYTISQDGSAIAWDLAGTRGIRRTFTPTGGGNWGVPPSSFSPDGTFIAVGLTERGIGLWDAIDLTPIGAALMETGGDVRALAISPDGNEVGAEVRALAISPDGQTVAAAADNGTVTIWDVASRSLRHQPIYTEPSWPSGPSGRPGLAFSPDGSVLITSGGSGVQMWDVATGTGLGGSATISNVVASDLSLSADGTLAAFALRFRGATEVWDVARRTRVANIPGDPEAEQFSVALSPDGRTLAVGGSRLWLWDVETEELLHELDPGGLAPISLQFSPDGHSLAAAGTLWDVATGTRIGPNLAAGLQGAPMMDFSPDGRHLLMTFGDGHAAVWDVDPVSWAERACALANRALTRAEWDRFLPGRPFEPACTL